MNSLTQIIYGFSYGDNYYYLWQFYWLMPTWFEELFWN